MHRGQEVNLKPSFTSKEILSKSHYGKDLVVAMNAPWSHRMLAEDRVPGRTARCCAPPPPHSAQQEKLLSKYLFAKNF